MLKEVSWLAEPGKRSWRLPYVVRIGKEGEIYKVCGFNGNDYEECRLLGYDAMWIL
jgi:hypothetical protein